MRFPPDTEASFPFTDWSLSPEALAVVLDRIRERGACAIVELGCGVSTIGIARVLQERGEGALTALEHDPGWAAGVRELLAAEDGGERATILDAPLEPHAAALDGASWYAAAALARLPQRVDFLLVDGPPGNEPGIEHSRYPALAALGERLAPGAIVVLDDAGRPGEREILRRWEAEHPIEFEPAAGGRLAVGSYGTGGSG